MQSLVEKLTLLGDIVAQLATDHLCISWIPEVITHCTPLSIPAHLHSPLMVRAPIDQPKIAIVTGDWGAYEAKSRQQMYALQAIEEKEGYKVSGILFYGESGQVNVLSHPLL